MNTVTVTRDGLSPAAQVIYNAVLFDGDNVTLSLVEQALKRKGFNPFGEMGLFATAWGNVLMWDDVNRDFIAWLKELTDPDLLHFQPASLLHYGYDALRIPNLPLIEARLMPPAGTALARPHWLPVTLNLGPHPDLGITSTPVLPAPKPHALYRFFGADGALLYIGLTLNPGARWKAHIRDKPWWLDVHTITIEHFPDRPSVEHAEKAAIKTEAPRHNVVHNRRRQVPAS